MKTKPFRLVALALVACGLLLVTACSPGTSTTPSGGATPGGSRQGGGQNGRFGGGVSGLIVAVSGKTLQVRTTAGQSAVSYTAKTTITEQQRATAASAKVGLCAVVRAPVTASSTPSGGTITAESVSLSSPTGTTCQAGFGGGGQRAGRNPSGAPTAAPSGAPDGRRAAAGSGAIGKIISNTGQSMVIEGNQPGSTATIQTTVTLSSTTTYTLQAKVGAKAVTTGKCVFAMGSMDKTGATAASALRLSAATNGTCNLGGPGRGTPGGRQTGG